MATAHYRSQYSDCPICSCDEFEAGFVDERLKADYLPNSWFSPDYEAMKTELEDQFGLCVSEETIEAHWELHVSLSQDDYRKWAREKTKHSPAKDPYGAGIMDGED